MPTTTGWTAGLLLILLLIATTASWGWGSPHAAITQAALSTLPEWQREALGEEYTKLGSEYCYIPDWIFSHPEYQPYARSLAKPDVVYLLSLHLPEDQAQNYETIRDFFGRAVEQLRAGNRADAAKFAGTVAHLLEDWGCPAHSVPGDNMFTLFKQFLPPPESFEQTLLHSPIEQAMLGVDLGDRQPRSLGESVDEAAFRLLHEANLAIINARSTVVPIINGLYAGDPEAVTAAQVKAATRDGQVVADALYSMLCLGLNRPDATAAERLATVDLSERLPLEAPQLFMPQSTFFSKPYWGFPQRALILEEGKTARPLVLKVDGEARTFEQGIGMGTRSVSTYLVPPGVFGRFTCWAGLHAELGGAGHVTLQVVGDGKALDTVELTGDQPAHRFECELGEVSRLQLVAQGAGGDGLGNYVVWGEPRLMK